MKMRKRWMLLLLAVILAMPFVSLSDHMSRETAGVGKVYADNLNWNAFRVILTTDQEVAAGNEVTFQVRVGNTTDQELTPTIYVWYYREEDNSDQYPGEGFGEIQGSVIQTNPESSHPKVTIPSLEEVTFTLTGTIPDTWNEKSQILVVISASADGCMGQGAYPPEKEYKEYDLSNAAFYYMGQTITEDTTILYNGDSFKFNRMYSYMMAPAVGDTAQDSAFLDLEYDLKTEYDYSNLENGFVKLTFTGRTSCFGQKREMTLKVAKADVTIKSAVYDPSSYPKMSGQITAVIDGQEKIFVHDKDFAGYTIGACTAGKVNDLQFYSLDNQYVYCITASCMVTAVPIKNTSISSIADKAYTGNALKPSPTVKYKGTFGDTVKLEKNKDYTVLYKNNTNPGIGTVTITGKGNYKGTVSKTFVINPKGTALSKLTAVKSGFTVTWKKQAKQISGYQIQYATNSKFTKGKKSINITKPAAVSREITKLKSKQKYYVRIRTYKKVDKKTYYSKWSSAKSITTK